MTRLHQYSSLGWERNIYLKCVFWLLYCLTHSLQGIMLMLKQAWQQLPSTIQQPQICYGSQNGCKASPRCRLHQVIIKLDDLHFILLTRVARHLFCWFAFICKEKAIVTATYCKYFICKLNLGCSLVSNCVSSLLVTPGFKDKTECITICMPGSSFIHIETS